MMNDYHLILADGVAAANVGDVELAMSTVRDFGAGKTLFAAFAMRAVGTIDPAATVKLEVKAKTMEGASIGGATFVFDPTTGIFTYNNVAAERMVTGTLVTFDSGTAPTGSNMVVGSTYVVEKTGPRDFRLHETAGGALSQGTASGISGTDAGTLLTFSTVPDVTIGCVEGVPIGPFNEGAGALRRYPFAVPLAPFALYGGLTAASRAGSVPGYSFLQAAVTITGASTGVLWDAYITLDAINAPFAGAGFSGFAIEDGL